MEPQELHLTSPDTHYIFLGGYNEGYSGPILGSVEITVPSSIHSSGYPNIKVALTRTVTSTRKRPDTTYQYSCGLFKRIQKRNSIQDKSTPKSEQSSSSDTETLSQCYLWHTPNDIQYNHDNNMARLKFNFAIPVHNKTPPTTETMLGSVSYAITAISTSIDGAKTTTSQPIQILRRAIPDFYRTIHHTRSFFDERVAVSLDLTPDESSAPDTKASYTGRLVAHRTIKPGRRPSERRHVVIKELRWRVEETVRVLSISGHGGTRDVKDECVRQLCDGSHSGHWSISKKLLKGEMAHDETIVVPFDIGIPRSANVAEEMGISAYSPDTKQPCRHDACECDTRTPTIDKRIVLSVSHRLRLDIIAGMDTIDQDTGRLVDRKPLWKLFGAFFCLPIHEFASPEDIPDAAFLANDIPPMYEDGFQPPSYKFE
ncbi:hypothetical protein PHISCL_06165 [Aspergillus sclerotialis]|uniref:Arrestin-like N-terminal domain-containing protein n=1 Tax=Aspergillus sclerotialis TaxID=2070753 RepID=A0A3A2ZGV6_9EURO|nr:hypothetical protein PHISCL_06165 [Aspergillus sclerotialis]